MTEQEQLALIEEVKGLLSLSAKVNSLTLGEGISAKEGGYSSGGYTEAELASLEKYSVSNVKDIQQLIRQVYTEDVAVWLEAKLFAPQTVDGVVLTPTRYYEAETSESFGNRQVLMVNTNYEPLLVGDVVYENVRLSACSSMNATVLVDALVTKDGKTQHTKDVSLTLVKQDGVWRFQDMTGVAFDLEKVS